MALYRKYRPQQFKDLIGQDHIRDALLGALRNNRIGHAYLLAGPRGLGKTTTARLLAKAVNCTKSQIPNPKSQNRTKTNEQAVEPCNQCEMCRDITSGRLVDVLEIDAASNRGIDEIRELRDKIVFPPTVARKKVYIIDEVHMLTKEAFNALLKTLEEPPAHALFILATTEPHKVPPTILSRVQRFDFRRATTGSISQALKKIIASESYVIADEAIEYLAELAEGSYRDGIALLDQVASASLGQVTQTRIAELFGLSDRQSVSRFLDLIFKGDRQKAFELLETLYQQGMDLMVFGKMVVDELRRRMIKEDRPDYASIIERFLTALGQIRFAPLPQLPLELVVIELTARQRKAQPSTGQGAGDQKASSGVKIADPQPTMAEMTDSQVKKAVDLKKWQALANAIRPHNHSLAMFFKVAKPLMIQGQRLKVGVQYKFHQERIEEPKNLKLINQEASRIFGEPLTIECTVIAKKTDQVEPPTEENLLSEVLAVFEGSQDGD